MTQIIHKIYTVRNQPVMLDEDLAFLYGVPTKVLNQAVKRNPKRFPKDFCFKITREESTILRSQIVTSSSQNTDNYLIERSNLKSQIVTSSLHGGRRKLPRAFTEQGAAITKLTKSSLSIFKNCNIVIINNAVGIGVLTNIKKRCKT